MACPLDDQRAAAEAELAVLAAPIRARPDVIAVDPPAGRALQIAAGLDMAARCPHLVNQPLQPTVVLLNGGDVVADCGDCWTARRGGVTSCTRCPDPPVGYLVHQVGHRLAVQAVCAACRMDVLAMLGDQITGT